MTKFYTATRDPLTVTDEVRDGVAVAHDWRRVIRRDGFFDCDKWRKVCAGEPCASVTNEDGCEYFWGIGPPYIMTKNDMLASIDDYCGFVVNARKITDDWMTEIEYWSFLDEGTETQLNPCRDPFELVIPKEPPVGFHYFSKYTLGDARGLQFYKREIPKDISECHQELLKVPTASEYDLVTFLYLVNPTDRSRKYHEVWAECTLIKSINHALRLLKRWRCASTGFNSFQGIELKIPSG
ncbi:hypothetical protein FI667_g11241, partial [Globisporangium splendens]